MVKLDFTNKNEMRTTISMVLAQSSNDDSHTQETPFALCEEIVDKLNEDINPNKKILVVATLELLYTIAMQVKDTSTIYFATTKISNDKISKKYKLASKWIPKENIFLCDGVLDNEGLQSMEFDVIVGNPPYQQPEVEGAVQPKSHSLWPRFIEEGLNLLKDGGTLSLVTPSSWMSPNNKIFKIFKQHNLKWITTDVSHHFNVGTTASCWAVSKSKYTGSTIINNNIIVDMNTCPYIVDGASLSIHDKVMFNNTNTLNMCQDTTTAHSSYTKKKPHLLSREISKVFKFPMWHTNRQVLHSSITSKCINLEKIIFTTSGYFKPFYDNGNYGVTECSFYIPVKSKQEGSNLLSLLNSKLINFIVSDAKWSGYLNWNVLKAIPAVDLSHSWTDDKLYNHFNLTTEEIQLIEKTIK